MVINFKEVIINNFQSIKKAKVVLSNQGVVLIKGINLYEEKTGSNGSGKSSIAESICYAIYGKTSKGIATCYNKFANDDCEVTLLFNIDNNEYKIVRGEKGKKHTGYVEFYCNGEDLTARNKTDTDKVIADTMPVNKDIFLSTIFLSQNFSGKLSALSPTGRKDRLEQITNTDKKLNAFKDRLTKVKSGYTEKESEALRRVSFSDGQLSFIDRQIIQLETSINNAKNEIEMLSKEDDIDIISLEEKIKIIDEKCVNLRTQLDTLVAAKDDVFKELSSKQAESATHYSRAGHLEKEIASLKAGKKCPTCGHQLVGAASADVINEKEIELRDEKTKVNNLSAQIQECNNKINILKEKINTFNSTINNLNSTKTNISIAITKASQKVAKIEAKENEITRMQENIAASKENKTKSQEEKDKANAEANDFNINQNVAAHCLQIVTKQFRNYLLDETINYMNSLLAEYSTYLFSNDIITISSDGTKLDIYLGEQLYESLSGGEAKKVDIALVLVQRELGININSTESNLIIYDEIFENCDEKAVENVTNLILEKCPAESVFIISHNNYSLPYDKEIIVVKGKDRCSKIQ